MNVCTIHPALVPKANEEPAMTANTLAGNATSCNIPFELSEIARAVNLGRMAAAELSDGQPGDLADLAWLLERAHVQIASLLEALEREQGLA